ncbi:MAG: hypothetical protein HOJ06_10330, partial [Rhodospirillaceae bacterium]|nr:hypothetical protein [Rhodospirillaceae bacterium]
AFSILTDREGRLSAASDDAQSAVGRPAVEIQAKPLFALFAEEDRPAIAQALESASHQSQTTLSRQKILTGTDSEALFDIALEPAGPDKFWVHFSPLADESGGDDPTGSGPLAKEDFLTTVAGRLGLPGGDDLQMLMVDIDGLRNKDLTARLGDDAANAVRSSIETALSEAAVDGQIGQLSASSYGVLGTGGQNRQDLVASVVDAASQHGVNEQDLGAKAESVALDAEDIDPEAVRGLLGHVLHKFQQTIQHGKPFGGSRLSEVSAEIEQAINLIETALDNGDIRIEARDVRLLNSGDIAFYLTHGVLVFGDEAVTADRLLVMGDHPELCSRHDRAVVMAAVASVASVASQEPPAPSDTPPLAPLVIVDIGMPTLESGEAARLAAELGKAGQSVGFRPQGLDMSARRSPGVKQVYGLLKDGVPVWLVNFSTAIEKSRHLKGAYVEISATFLRDISASPDRDKLLTGLLKVWSDVEVRLVAVNVDSRNLATFVSKLGIAHGVGVAADPAADAPQSTRDIATKDIA